MIEKYNAMTIYEIENGWLLKEEKAINPHEANQDSYITIYFKNIIKLTEYIKKNYGDKK